MKKKNVMEVGFWGALKTPKVAKLTILFPQFPCTSFFLAFFYIHLSILPIDDTI